MSKALFTASIFLISATVGYAQKKAGVHTAVPVNSVGTAEAPSYTRVYAKGTAAGDTSTLSNIADPTTTVLYTAGNDSGYLTGMNTWGDKGFAELYTINGNDSSVRVLGVATQFSGRVNAASTRTISLKVWSQDADGIIAPALLHSGYPGAVLTAKDVAVTQLGIGTVADTMKFFLFDSITSQLSSSFFAGYDMDYNFNTLDGDTIAVVTSPDGVRAGVPYTLSYITDTTGDTTAVDTTIIVHNATQWSDNTWHDNYTENDSLYNDLAIYPIVAIGGPTGVHGVTTKELVFYGNYPNPAVNSTNISFALNNRADVTLQVSDMSGRTVYTAQLPAMAAGSHIVPLNTTGMPAGDYIYLLHTNSGAGIAGKISVVK